MSIEPVAADAATPPRLAPFHTLLVANRGEIACRIIRSARLLGIRTVAVYSEADRQARHVALADEAVLIGPAPPAQSYLHIPALLMAATRTGATAVHPGYGFLSENPAFAQACADAALVFVGPSAAAMRALGNKAQAKRIARSLGLSASGERLGRATLHSGDGAHETENADGSDDAHHRDDANAGDDALRLGAAIGYPLLVKAAAGGGGRGMRRVDSAQDLPAALQAARRESLAAFGSDEMLLEPYIANARHIEIQLLADSQGNIVHLGERDCSTQRRHQKIIEEAPAPGVSPALREAMGTAAIALARHVNYVGAGTVEFLLGEDGRFHFLEMNTRLQVEHTVTEMITGLDLVALQLQIATGGAVPFGQGDVRFEGHAIQARVCAEDPWQDFMPQSGMAGEVVFPPQAADLRIDHGLMAPAVVPRHYDSMIAKLIVQGPDRDDARRRLQQALMQTRIPGLRTNLALLIQCLQHEVFATARLHTQWLTQAIDQMQRPKASSRWIAAAAAMIVRRDSRVHGELAGFSSGPPLPAFVRLMLDEGMPTVRLAVHDAMTSQARIDWPAQSGESGANQARACGGHALRLIDCKRIEIDGLTQPCSLVPAAEAGRFWFQLGDETGTLTRAPGHAGESNRAFGDGRIRATMHGMVSNVQVAQGDRITAGQPLLSLEAMKIEHRITADVGGLIAALHVRVGDQVAPGAVMVLIEPDEAG